MKKIILLFLSLLIASFPLSSQVEAKIGVFASVPFGIYLTGEYGIHEDVGIEVGIVSNPGTNFSGSHISGTSLMLNTRMYFSPNYGLDRFYAGLYFRPHIAVIKDESSFFSFPPSGPPTRTITQEVSRDSGVGLGFIMGKKFVRKRKFIDLNIGFGRNFGRKVYAEEQPSPGFFRTSGNRVKVDFFYSIVFGIRI